LRAGHARRIVKPGQTFNRTHVADIAQAIGLTLAASGQGGVWNVADEEPAPPQDVIAFAADLIGMEPPPEEPFDSADMTPMARSFYADNKKISIAKLKRELGFRPLYPTYREGLRALAAMGEGKALAR
jgi:nucleoside-diphosphate-sugar epimerase